MSIAETKRSIWRVHVYGDHPAWATVERWFLMPDALLKELYTVTYEVDDHDDAPDINEANPQIRWIREQHPGAVLVY